MIKQVIIISPQQPRAIILGLMLLGHWSSRWSSLSCSAEDKERFSSTIPPYFA
jgi:hypothetical protein